MAEKQVHDACLQVMNKYYIAAQKTEQEMQDAISFALRENKQLQAEVEKLQAEVEQLKAERTQKTGRQN